MKQEDATAIFRLAGFTVTRSWELMNQYWPRHPNYYDEIVKTPWWLVETEIGLVQIGWRKNVIHIDWSETKARGIVTNDEVTKSDQYVHAYNTAKAVEYLAALRTFSANVETAYGVGATTGNQP